MRIWFPAVLLLVSLNGCSEKEAAYEPEPGGRMYCINEKTDCYEPRYSPDGSRVLFVYANDLWTMPGTGGEAVKRSDVGKAIRSPGWRPGPGSKTVCFIARETPDKFTIMAMELDGSPREVYTSSSEIRNTSWSSDGEWIVFQEPSRGKGVFKVPAAGGDPELIGNNSGWETVLSCRCAIHSNTVLYSVSTGKAHYVYRLGIGGGDPELVFQSPVSVSDLAESRDGRYVAFIGASTSGQSESTDLWIGSVTSGETKMAASMGGDRFKFGSPDWSPDGKNIVFMIYDRAPGDGIWIRPKIFRLEVTPGFI